jgi:hypothetical protein
MRRCNARHLFATLAVLCLSVTTAPTAHADGIWADKFFGPSVPPGGWLPECARYTIVDTAQFSTVSTSASAGWGCDTVLARPAGFITVDITNVRNQFGVVCSGGGASSNANNTSIAQFQATCGGPPGTVVTFHRSSHWYKWNGSWFLKVVVV